MSRPVSALVISLDFELHWGVQDRRPLASYRDNLLGVREAIPALLNIFREYEVHGTWAAVGLLLCENRQELLSILPSRRPAYHSPSLLPDQCFRELGANERDDPFHYGLSLARQIVSTPGQELGTHTFSHYYCLEAGQSKSDFEAELAAAREIAARRGLPAPRSIVFPRNQVNPDYLASCAAAGLVAFRGNPRHAMYSARNLEADSRFWQAQRLIDAYLPLAGSSVHPWPAPGALVNVPASRFLRPSSARAAAFERFRLGRIASEMTRTARRGGVYHLWWHPHNFGVRLRENLAVLRRVLDHYRRLRDSFGMRSIHMSEVAAAVAGEAA